MYKNNVTRPGSSNRSAVTSENGGEIVLYFDGLCEPRNPGGVATFGVVVYMGKKKIFSEGGLALARPFSDEASNNVAEYSALIRGMSWLIDNGLNRGRVTIRGDSRLVVNQLRGEFKVKARRIVELYHRASELLSQFRDVKVEWVDRSKNSEADLQSRIAYTRFLREENRKRS